MGRYKITVEYDGTPFHGWQRQDGVDTVQRRLEESAVPFLKKHVVMHGSGRTDVGVHALEQVAHFDYNGEDEINCFRLQECMNAYLKDAPIVVLSLEKTDGNFNARLSAIERYYCYKILNRRAKACIDANRVWNVTNALDVEKMQLTARHLVGKHDFSSFRAAGCQSKSPVKTLNSISVARIGNLIELRISSRSFLYRQVRNIVGSLVFVGCSRWSEQDFIDVFHAKDRTKAAPTAPACGLYFMGTRY